MKLPELPLGLDPVVVAWVLVVTALGLYVLLRALGGLRVLRELRLKRLQRRVRFDAVPTESPVDDPHKVAIGRGKDAIEAQFTITRRLLIPVTLLLVFALASLPFLSTAPAAIISILVAVLTVVGGIALRPFVENAMAGFVISTSKLINIGDTVLLEDHYGTVEDVTLTHTTVKIWDWRRYIVPNARMMQSSFINYSLHDRYYWAHIEFWVEYEADLEEVERLAIEAANQCATRFDDDEDAAFWIMDMEKEGVRCWLAAWADTPSNAWTLKAEMRKRLIAVLKARGIRPHRVHAKLDGSPLGVVSG